MVNRSQEVYDIIEQLRDTNSRIEKENILKSLDGMIAVRFVLFLQTVYGKMHNYWYSPEAVLKNANDDRISVYPEEERKNQTYHDMDFFEPWVSNCLEAVKLRKITGHEGLNLLTKVYLTLDEISQQLFLMVLDRDIRAGVTPTTFNKVWKGDFEEFKVMLCHTFDEKTKPKNYPVIAQLKYDAARIIIFVNESSVTYRTRNGKFYDIQNKQLDDEFKLLLKTLKTNKTITEKGYQNGVVFDGELYQLDNETGRPKSRQISNGVATKLIKQTASEEEQKDIGITVWDCIPYAEFQKGLHKTEYQHRLNDLKFALEENSKIEHIALVESKLCYNEQEVFDTASKLIANGEEGIIVKTVDGPYENKRSKFALKIKDVLEADLKVVAIQEGTGKYKGKIGALLCESGDGNVKVSVGSGLTDEQRSLPESDYIGKIISVKYNTKIPNYDKSGETLFLPRFVEIRLDKDSADIL
jgi:hypothetical protein